jgi:hypothetical protein
MSKWINKNLFNDFRKEKTEEKEQQEANSTRRSDVIWPTPERGTSDRPNVYEGRFLPDKKGNFYRKYYYHMFQVGDRWIFILCPKTHNFNNFCAWCSVTSKLYMGSEAEKNQAREYKRKEKYVGNFFIIDDFRDKDREQKMVRTVRLYEFPAKVESKLKEEITDTKNGLGHSIFDPGEEGYNFILKVLSTKAKDGRTWPDYSNSIFSRKPCSIADTDKEIKEILDSTHDLDEYIKGLRNGVNTVEILLLYHIP